MSPSVPCCWTCNRAKSNNDKQTYLYIMEHLAATRNIEGAKKHATMFINRAGDYQQYQKNAQVRNYEWGLDENTFNKIVVKPCTYCQTTFSNSVGIDRWDNTKGYTIENAVPCCTTCNIMKNESNGDQFLAHATEVFLYQNNKLQENRESKYDNIPTKFSWKDKKSEIWEKMC
jgi:hypothetical protein